MARKKQPARKDRKVKVPRKTVIFCPLRHRIGTLSNDILEGDTPHARHIKFIGRQKREAGEPLVCKVCGHPYVIAGNIRTEAGWLPAKPNIERPMPRFLRRSSR